MTFKPVKPQLQDAGGACPQGSDPDFHCSNFKDKIHSFMSVTNHRLTLGSGGGAAVLDSE